MWEKLEIVLNNFEEETKIPYYRQGSLIETDTLPESFVTFWNISTPESSFYDNNANSAVWSWSIYFYTKDPSKIYSMPIKILNLARAEGFILQGQANDISSGISGYLGRFFQLKYLEKY